MKKILGIMVLFAAVVSSCVPGRQYQELEVTKNQLESSNQTLRADMEKLRSDFKDLEAENRLRNEDIGKLNADTTFMGETNRELRDRYDKLNELNDMLMSKNTSLMEESVKENRKLLTDLERVNKELQGKEDRLTTLEGELNEKEANLNEVRTNLDAAQANLAEREARVNELESTLNAQGEAMNALKNKVADALLGFKDKGLKVEQKDGKVYVSLEAKLLFPSGSTKINAEGKQALIDLAKAVEGQQDLEVIVEGHTDTDKLSSGSHPKNNWELSVLRSTAVVEIMLDNSDLDPTTLSAAGKGEFKPIDPADKAKNRRIEIILTPNLDELFDIIQQ